MNIYAHKFCVYLTVYRGNKLPPFYIGSSSVDKINNGYKGSVDSIKYGSVWKNEIKINKHLFKTIIISTHKTRKEATQKENKLQKLLNVVKSSLYINMAYAAPNGFFGMDVSGENNPNHNNKWDDIKKEKASKIQKENYIQKSITNCLRCIRNKTIDIKMVKPHIGIKTVIQFLRQNPIQESCLANYPALAQIHQKVTKQRRKIQI